MKVGLAIPNCKRHYWCYHHRLFLPNSVTTILIQTHIVNVKERETILMDSIITKDKGSLVVHVILTDTSPFQIKVTHHLNSHVSFP